MPETGSVSEWLTHLRSGDAEAAQKLWERYFHRLVRLARQRLQAMPRRTADEEDVALSAFDSFCRGAGEGRFPQLRDRHNLWALLVTITGRKASQLRRNEGRQKRGTGQVFDEAALADQALSGSGVSRLEQVPDPEPTPAFAAQVAEECGRLLGLLADPELRLVAQWKMEGYTNDEIAGKLGYAVRSIERKLRVIRAVWGQDKPQP